MTML